MFNNFKSTVGAIGVSFVTATSAGAECDATKNSSQEPPAVAEARTLNSTPTAGLLKKYGEFDTIEAGTRCAGEKGLETIFKLHSGEDPIRLMIKPGGNSRPECKAVQNLPAPENALDAQAQNLARGWLFCPSK